MLFKYGYYKEYIRFVIQHLFCFKIINLEPVDCMLYIKFKENIIQGEFYCCVYIKYSGNYVTQFM